MQCIRLNNHENMSVTSYFSPFMKLLQADSKEVEEWDTVRIFNTFAESAIFVMLRYCSASCLKAASRATVASEGVRDVT